MMKQLKNRQELTELNKNDRKAYINENGGFIKFECNVVDKPEEFTIPDGTTYVEGVISTGELNMNGYKIDINAWTEEVIKDYFDTWNGLMYYQHDMDIVIGKTLNAKVVGNEFRIQAYFDDKLIENRFALGLSRDFSTGHYNLEVMYENSNGKRISESDFQAKEQEVWSASDDWGELEENFDELYNEWTLVVTKLVFIEYSLVNVGSNRSSKAKSFSNKKTNSISGILANKGYNSLSTYILEMKKENKSFEEAKLTNTNEVLATNEPDEKETNNEQVIDETKVEETVIDGTGGEEKQDEAIVEVKKDDDLIEEVEEKVEVEEIKEEIKAEVEVEEIKEEVEEEKIETPKEEMKETDGKAPEKEGETPEVVSNNSLGIQTNQIKMLSNALIVANETIVNFSEVISNQKSEIVTLQAFVDTAKEITIKNGIFGKEEAPVEKSKLEREFESAMS